MEIQNSVPSIGWTHFSIDQKIKKFIRKLLPRSIESRVLLDQSKLTFNRLKGMLDWSRQWRISSWSFCLTRSVLDSSSINWKEHSIDQKEFLIDRNSHNWIFQEFSNNCVRQFLLFSIKNSFWFYEWRFTYQTLRF